MIPDQVFCLRGDNNEPVWFAMVNGQVIAATWRDRGAALAGLQTEQRRAIAKELAAGIMPYTLRPK